MAGDRRRDAVPVPGRALPVGARNRGAAVGAERAVAAGGVPAGEVAQQDEFGRGRTKSVKARRPNR